MSSSKHAIIGTSIISIFTLLLTYLASINFGCITLNSPWLTKDFLLAVFGGIFASSFVVMLCEIQKFLMSKTSIEYTLYYNAVILFSQVVTMQNILDQYFKRPNERVVKDALDNSIQKSFEITQGISACDYNPFFKKRSMLLKALRAFKEEERQIRDILNECHCYYKIAINSSIISHMQNGEAPDVFSKDDIIQGVLKALITRVETLKKICDSLLIGIDYKGKYQWNIKKQDIDFESIKSIRALDLEEYIKKYGDTN